MRAVLSTEHLAKKTLLSRHTEPCILASVPSEPTARLSGHDRGPLLHASVLPARPRACETPARGCKLCALLLECVFCEFVFTFFLSVWSMFLAWLLSYSKTPQRPQTNGKHTRTHTRPTQHTALATPKPESRKLEVWPGERLDVVVTNCCWVFP